VRTKARNQEVAEKSGELRWLPILRGESVNLRSGTSASGRCSDSTTVDATTSWLAPCGPAMSATASEGTMATARETMLRSQSGRESSRKPSMTNCPANVPVMVELCPEASSAIAHSVEACGREMHQNNLRRVSPAGREHSQTRTGAASRRAARRAWARALGVRGARR